MSIRARLTLMLILGLTVPIILMSLISPLVAGDKIRRPLADLETINARYTKNKEVVKTVNDAVDILSTELTKNPDRIYDNEFMRSVDSKLSEIYASIVASTKGDKHIYVTEGLDLPFHEIGANSEELAENKVVVFNWEDQFIIHRTLEFEDYGGNIISIMIMTPLSSATKVRSIIARNITMIISFIAVVYTVLVYYVARSINNPLEKLKVATQKVSERDFSYRIGIYTKDKIGEVSKGFDYMMERMEEVLTLRRKYEDNRKELIASISHDLKTPLTSIKVNAAAINDGIADTDEKKEKAFAIITSKIDYMQNLIEELFLYSKLDMNNEEFNFQEVPFNRFIEDVVEEWQMEHDPEEVKVIFKYDKEMSYLMDMDVDKLKRVMVNILENSVKYAGVKPLLIHIALVRKLESNEYVLSIDDNGVGVAEEETKKMFDHFYRADVSRNSEITGSGLGLAISKRIIEGHQGKIEARSGINQGMHMYVTVNAKREVM